MNIYVGNLSYEVTEEDLKKAFEIFGEVDTVKVIKDNYTGRSKGFGFVETSAKSEAQSAIEGLNGKDLKVWQKSYKLCLGIFGNTDIISRGFRFN